MTQSLSLYRGKKPIPDKHLNLNAVTKHHFLQLFTAGAGTLAERWSCLQLIQMIRFNPLNPHGGEKTDSHEFLPVLHMYALSANIYTYT